MAAWEPSSIAQRLRDVVIYGSSILETVQNLSFEDFARDPIRQKAVAYDFQCVSDATAGVLKLDPSLSERYPSIPWSQVRALANVTRHEELGWRVRAYPNSRVTGDLPGCVDDVQGLIEQL